MSNVARRSVHMVGGQGTVHVYSSTLPSCCPLGVGTGARPHKKPSAHCPPSSVEQRSMPLASAIGRRGRPRAQIWGRHERGSGVQTGAGTGSCGYGCWCGPRSAHREWESRQYGHGGRRPRLLLPAEGGSSGWRGGGACAGGRLNLAHPRAAGALLPDALLARPPHCLRDHGEEVEM